jgi:hypothetical protein
MFLSGFSSRFLLATATPARKMISLHQLWLAMTIGNAANNTIQVRKKAMLLAKFFQTFLQCLFYIL